VKEDKTKAELKNAELYVGKKWDLGSVFKNVVDKDGNPIKPEAIKHVWIDGQETREIDTSKTGEHTVQIAILNANNEWVYSNKVTVAVKEDKTKAELKDTELYVGQKWDLGSVFKNVVDKDGNPIKPEEVEWVWIDGKEKVREIDTSKPGKHTVKIAVRNAADKDYWVVSNEVTVTVKEDKTSLELNLGDHYIYQGQYWDPKRGLKKATDADGNILSIDKVKHWWGGDRPIDINKVGDSNAYFYRVYRKDGSNIYNNVYVHVKEDKTKAELKNAELYVGKKWDLGSVFKNVVDKDGNPIKPEAIKRVWIDGQETREIDTSKT
ncbi:bacterial Ig-like domain-containing protein, partial [Enterococcus faecalis]